MRHDEFCHDLREPTAAIMLLAAAAELEADDPTAVQRRLRQIRSEARWLGRLLDSGARDEPCLLDVGALVGECLEGLQLWSSVSVRAETEADVPCVEAPPIALRRAVNNVVANAARAAGPDGEVFVRLHERAGDVVLDVVDDGPGFGRIPTQHGLGLRVTETVLTSIGGSVSVSAGPAGGTGVRLTIPVSGGRPGGSAGDR